MGVLWVGMRRVRRLLDKGLNGGWIGVFGRGIGWCFIGVGRRMSNNASY